MGAFSYVPGPPLSDFVERFWLYERYGGRHARERVLPSGTMEMVMRLDAPSSLPVVCGAHSQGFVIETAARPSILGVHFKPGGAFPFFGLPAGELHNVRPTLDLLWGTEGRALRDRVLEARTPAGKFRALERCLLARAKPPLARHPAVAFAVNELGSSGRRVFDVTDAVGMSARRFIQLFSDEVGLTPKLYGRVRRFHAALQRLAREPDVDWTDLALDGGYYDQAHFIHDFRAFSGLSPTAYRRAPRPHPGHVPID